MPGDEEGLEDTKSVHFSHIGIWGARLKDVKFQRRILEEALMFALAYAAISDMLDWPEIDAKANTAAESQALAHNSWEITQVNQLLKSMERFHGTFTCATNLMKHVDKAAKRRFTFKLAFHALTTEPCWAMFINETGLGERVVELSEAQIAQYKDELVFVWQLILGDFATVKCQCKMLRRTLTPDEWISQLKIEVDIRTRENEELERASIGRSISATIPGVASAASFFVLRQ